MISITSPSLADDVDLIFDQVAKLPEELLGDLVELVHKLQKSEVVMTVHRLASMVFEVTSDSVEGLATTISNGWNEVQQTVRNAGEALVTVLAGITNDIGDAVDDLMTGIGEGISDFFDSIF